MDQPMLLARFPGGPLSIEFIGDEPDDDPPGLGPGFELQADDAAALRHAGLTRVEHPMALR
jgi:hypothetical protein